MLVADTLYRAIGYGAPIQVKAYDGSSAGPDDAPVSVEVRSPRALSYLVSSPGTLGLARAYVSGELTVPGELYAAMAAIDEATLDGMSRAEQLKVAARLGSMLLRHPIRPLPEEAGRRWGRRHSKARDQRVISHHYDVSNRFYEWVLGPSMTYTCAVYPNSEADLEKAQWTKHELVARKLALEPGMKLLDVGCGWGGMVMHAAAEHGVEALGVTLSVRQAEWAQAEIARRGLGDLARVEHMDYRDAPESTFDAISSIGLTEHIGRNQLGPYFDSLHARLRPGGRLLNHCITKPHGLGPRRTDRFTDRFVFPDGELHPIGTLVSLMNDAGFEIRHEENLREHYAMTLAAWVSNLEAHWGEAVDEVGERRARVWRLYMSASRLAFERDGIQLHQVLGVKLDGHDAHMPLRPDW
jgi:cyclopropane-fatty-acyl-phospholipid synthase